MGLSKQNGLHGNAVEWYYGIMAERGPGVPEAVFRHVWRCLVGRRQTYRLQGAVHGADGEIQGSRSRWLRDARKNMMKRDVIDTLSRHFRCLEEQVTCARVRPFLPGLLLPAVRLRIPTPITVHIDQCGECAEDLAVLRDLGLGDEQLERLERLYQQASSKRPRLNLIHARLCRRARSRIDDFTRGGLEKIDREILDHLCTCPHCRPLVHESRQRLLESDSRVACADEGTKITMAELFDYAVPYGRTEDAVWPDHVRDCPACRRRIQQLDETIYGIAERTDSGIATIYSTIEPERHSPGVARDASDDVSARASDGQDTLRLEDLARWIADPYPQYPIRVQVLRGRPEPAVVPAAPKRAACDPRVRFLLKTAVAAAAMIPLAFIFLNTSTAAGITLGQMCKAFEKAPNIHVSRFNPSTDRLLQEFWISREMSSVLAGKGQERILYDLGARKKSLGGTGQAPAQIVELSESEYANWRRFVESCLGFTIGSIPSGAKWTRVADSPAQRMEVYELTCTERGHDGTTAFRKWRIVADPATRLPKEVQAFRKLPSEDQWHYHSRTEFGYLTQEEMAAIMASL